MDYVPVTTLDGNQLYVFAGILAHNLTREIQIQMTPRARGNTAKRAALWCFREIATLRRILIQRAGRIIGPAGKLILSMNSNEKVESELLHSLGELKAIGARSTDPRIYATIGKTLLVFFGARVRTMMDGRVFKRDYPQ